LAFFDILNDSLAKECGGRHGGKGHEFQRYWALCHLLQIDQEKDDYLLLMEFIEDVAVLDKENVPGQMELYQLKKKEGGTAKWTKAALLKRPKDGKSILAKLHESKSIAKEETKAIVFVSNAPVELKLANGENAAELFEFSATQIETTLFTDLVSSIAIELNCKQDTVDFSNVSFLRSPLAMDDLENHATGKVATFLATKFPDHAARADVLCKALYNEIKVKATSTEKAATFVDLKRIRGISKSQFSTMLKLTLSRKSDMDIVDNFLLNLAQENIPYIERDAIKQEARRFIVDKSSKDSDWLLLFQEHVKKLLLTLPDNLITSWDVANWVVDQLVKFDIGNKSSVFGRNYLIAVTLYWMNQ